MIKTGNYSSLLIQLIRLGASFVIRLKRLPEGLNKNQGMTLAESTALFDPGLCLDWRSFASFAVISVVETDLM